MDLNINTTSEETRYYARNAVTGLYWNGSAFGADLRSPRAHREMVALDAQQAMVLSYVYLNVVKVPVQIGT